MSLDSDISGGFQVKYLGSVSFVRKKRQALKGIASLQKPLLDLYTGARRRGENHRSIHPLALTQQLEVCSYGLVVAEATGRGETVVTKVVTPLCNVVLWAAVRFHARLVKRRALGAAFVPLACSEGALDQRHYIGLSSRQRFLVSLSHPAVFACIFRRVSSPTTFECHAFVCAAAEDALAVANLATVATLHADAVPTRAPYCVPQRRRVAASLDSGGTECYATSDASAKGAGPYGRGVVTRTDTEEESNSYASLANKMAVPSPRHPTRRRSPRYFRFVPKSHAHREARALITRCGDRKRTNNGTPWMVAPQRVHEEREVSTSSFERDDPRPAPEPRFRESSTMTDSPRRDTPRAPPTLETLAETIDLSSEGPASSSVTSEGGWQPLPPLDTAPLVKFTYFGFETYARPTHMGTDGFGGRSSEVSRDSTTKMTTAKTIKDPKREVIIRGNGTGKVTINVPYTHLRPESRTSSSSSRTVPHGVRTFQKNGHVRHWSSLSQTSSGSSRVTPSTFAHHHHAVDSGSHHQQQKMLRWSSEDRLPRRQGGGFFWSLKRLSIQSLNKAKHKTGKFFTSVKKQFMGTKKSSVDGSEDSAYDTSEVCLSPSGQQSTTNNHLNKPQATTRRQQSWSFHDLRTASAGGRRLHNLPHRRKHRRRRKVGRSSSSSDSGVEAACHSDCSGGRRSGSEHGRIASNGVTRVQVEHGMGSGTFQRWSSTNIHGELGYIP